MTRIFTLFLVMLTSVLSLQAQNCSEKPFYYVVMGSSTAYGNGAVPIADSSFANIFKKYVKEKNSASEVYNIAIGATNTYHANPTWYLPPAGRPSPNTVMNITRAINEFKPDGIIISFPSNDAVERYTLDEQKANFERIVNVADSFNVPVWVTSTQPRNESSAVRQDLVTLRDWLATRFGSRYIDCWTGLAASDGFIAAEYAYGDGIHVNNKGHRLIAERLMAKDMTSVVCGDAHKLRNFSVGRLSGRGYLQWRSEGERFLSHYAIQSSTNGTYWDSVGVVMAKGVTNVPYNYEFTTRNAVTEKTFFRLKMVDARGRITYSDNVELNTNSAFTLSTLTGTADANFLHLSWYTGREQGLARFVIENYRNSQWDSVTMVKSTGNSEEPQTYGVDLGYTLIQLYTYRLRVIDSAGNSFYSASVVINPNASQYVTFKTMKVEVVNDYPIFSWTTSMENNTRRMNAQRRPASASVWGGFDQRDAGYMSTIDRNYTVTDDRRFAEDVYYRVAVENQDGTYTYSNEILLKHNGLPYVLSGFTAVASFDRAVITWKTLAEKDLRAIYVEHSTDSSNWKVIQTITPAPSNLPYSYEHTDYLGKTNYYRINFETTAGIQFKTGGIKVLEDSMYAKPFRMAGKFGYELVNNRPVVKWTTTAEKGLVDWKAERSLDNGVNWLPVGVFSTTPAYGAEGKTTNYTATDYTTFDQDIRYRLSVTDKLNRIFYIDSLVLPRSVAPFNLNSFSGEGDFGSSALRWQTQREKISSKILLRRSADPNKETWDIVAVAKAAGNSNTPVDYSYIDKWVSQVPLYYKLDMEDSLGRHIYSDSILLTPDTLYAKPYRLGDFSGTASANQQLLHWETTAEKNTLRFVVDRSSDSSNWTYGVDTLAAAGVGAHLAGKKYNVTYTYNISTTTNKVYYRLRLQDTLVRNFTVATIGIAADTNFANPFRLASFAASRGLDRQTLTWSTVKEWNSEYFRIERYIGTSGWLAVDSVKAAGMSSALKNYTFIDTGYSEKDINYRLVMLDKYGRSFISPSSLLTADTNYTRFYRLGTFTAVREGDKQTINWQTTKEWNTVKFVIERNNDNAWIRIDSVNAAGMAMEGKTYKYTDTAYSPKETYYRLVVSDKYNRTERSGEAFVRIDSNYVTPYRLTNYTAKRDLDKQVVNWTTTKEFRLKNFLVERNNGTGWLPVDSFAATNVAAGSVYTYTDKQYAEKETYYRIEVRDQFGRATRQGEVFVRVDSNYITPIRLASFTAVRSNSDRVLNWATSKEFRSKQFKLERKGTAGSWDSVYAVAGAGIAMTGKAYTYTDTAFLSEALTYRLVMTDLSNQVFTSTEVKVVADTDYITPYRIVNFTVKQDKDKQVISWTSVKEWNIVGYEIERHVLPATGGREMEEGWEVIASIKATGVEAGEKNYTYTDAQTQEKQIAYRVIVLDKFGRDFTTPSVSLTPNLGYKNAFNLTAFSVTRQSGNRVLQWRTDSENGSARFVIERSTDSTNWTQLNTIDAAGTSAVAKDYNFTDASATTTVWVYYRLRMVDAKGETTLSNAVKILALITALPDAPQLPDGKVIVYPNPAATEIRVAGYGRNVHMEIFNSQGQRVYRHTQYNDGEINVSSWPAGMYFILLEKGKYRLNLIKL